MTVLRPLFVAIVAALLAVAGVVVGAAPSHATTFDDVGAALRSDPLYVDPKSPIQLDTADANAITSSIQSAGTPIFVAVLPPAALEAAGGSPDSVLQRMRNSTGLPGTYATLIGTSDGQYGFQGASTLGTVGDLASEAYRENAGDPSGTIEAFVNSVDARAAGGGLSQGSAAQGSSGARGSSEESSGGAGILAVLALAGVAGGGAIWMGRRKQQKQLAISTAEVRRTLDSDITAYGEALDTIAPDLSDARLGDEGRAEVQGALDKYDEAKRAADNMRSPDDAAKVTGALDDGRWYVACVSARLAGEPLPERRPPCFFDPRHGLSVKDVPFAPDSPMLAPQAQGMAGAVAPTQGTVRDVPACQACATAIADGGLPNMRMIEANGAAQPYWNSGRNYAGYARGYYHSNADLMTTVFMATMLGNMMMHNSMMYHGGMAAGGGDFGGGGGSGWGGDSSGGGFFDGGGGGGWGGFGGGDFGGGGW